MSTTTSITRHYITPREPNPHITKLCEELQRLQRQRAILLKSRNMNANRIQAIVAGTLGYSSGMAEKDRRAKFAEATKVIDSIDSGNMSHELAGVALVHIQAINRFNEMKAEIEVEMKAIAKQLPVAAWLERPAQRGFGLPFLSIVIGETGNLSNYPNPGKLWKRLGCAPFTKEGETLMGATWRSRAGGKGGIRLSSEEWEQMGYSPRRRSVAYLIGESMVKLNQKGPYRSRWLSAKVQAFRTHPEWTWSKCEKCDEGENEETGEACGTCGGTGKKCARANNHGMLLATKLLLKNLWIEWVK